MRVQIPHVTPKFNVGRGAAWGGRLPCKEKRNKRAGRCAVRCAREERSSNLWRSTKVYLGVGEWHNPSALGAEDRRFKSCHPDRSFFDEDERQHPIEDWDRPEDFGYQLLIDANPRSTHLLVLKSFAAGRTIWIILLGRRGSWFESSPLQT